MLKKTLSCAVAAALSGLPGLALAHAGHAGAAGFIAGLTHPLGGVDHLLAMVTVGWLAGRVGGCARWSLPLAFVIAMLGGAVLGYAGLAPAGVDESISLSLIVFGMALAAAAWVSAGGGCVLAGVFAVAHGLAHAIEAPAAGGGYVLGFTLTTLVLISLGGGIAAVLGRLEGGTVWSRLAGCLVAATGGWLLLA